MSEAPSAFVRSPRSPSPPPDDGVRIAVSSRAGNDASWILHGVCRLSEAEARALSDTILDNVTIVCTFGSNLVPLAFPVVRDEMVFPDDISDASGSQIAYFNVELGSCGVPPGQGRYFVLASFHVHLSDVIEFDWER